MFRAIHLGLDVPHCLMPRRLRPRFALDRLDAMARRTRADEAIVYRDLLIVAFLCSCPLRAGNVCRMALGETVHVDNDVIVGGFGGSAVKNREAIHRAPLELLDICILADPEREERQPNLTTVSMEVFRVPPRMN